MSNAPVGVDCIFQPSLVGSHAYFPSEQIHHISYSYRLLYVQRTFFPHRLRMSVSYPEAGAYVPTFSRIGITLRRRRPHESSSRPPCRPFPGAVEAGGHGGKRSKRKGPRRVEKKAPKRAEHSDFYSFNDKILDLLQIFITSGASGQRADAHLRLREYPEWP